MHSPLIIQLTYGMILDTIDKCERELYGCNMYLDLYKDSIQHKVPDETLLARIQMMAKAADMRCNYLEIIIPEYDTLLEMQI